MDNLLEIATKTLEEFNPQTDTVDDFEPLPDGKYDCLLEDVTSRKSEKGTNWISFKFSIITGEYENRLIFVNYFFTEKTTERSIKGITKISYNFGYEITPDAFATFETLAETLNQMAGNQAVVTQTTSKSGWTNYNVTPINF